MQLHLAEKDVYVGQPVQLEPEDDGRKADPYYQKKLNGRITYINRKHRFFSVTYEQFGKTLTESFKF